MLRILGTLAIAWLLSYLLQAYLKQSHYTVLGLHSSANKQEVSEAYQRARTASHYSEKIERAFEVLSNDLRRRDYDNFGLDEHGSLQADEYLPIASSTASLNVENFAKVLESDKPLLVQVYSEASRSSREFASIWERIAETLEDQFELGRVEAGDSLAKFLAKRDWSTSRPTYRSGLPALIAFPLGCKKLSCVFRYSKELNYESVVDWVATQVLGLPRIRYYSSETLVPDLIAKAGRHKVKVIIFSETGERAAPFLREAARSYSNYAAFGCVLWLEHEAYLWKSRLGVESAPAVVFIKESGVQPVVVYGKTNRTAFLQLMEENKLHVLPQLRSSTAGELGCDIAGHSAAGLDVLTWYCVIAAGKPGYKLDQLRSTMRLVQDEFETNSLEPELELAAVAFKQKRLALTWLDGEVQKKFCYYLVSSNEEVYRTCGPREYGIEEDDLARVFMIRFRRDPVEEEKLSKLQQSKKVWEQLAAPAENWASILIARYNASEEVSDIASWIAQTVKDGDSQELPYYRMKSAPVLIPEDPTSILTAPREYASRASSKFGNGATSFFQGLLDLLKDARLVTLIVLALTMYFLGFLQLKKKQQTPSSNTGDTS